MKKSPQTRLISLQFNPLLGTDTQPQNAASRRLLRAGHLHVKTALSVTALERSESPLCAFWSRSQPKPL